MLTLALLAALTPLPQDLAYAQEPAARQASSERLGEWIPDVTFTDLAGKRRALSSLMGEHGLVIILRDADCPLSKRYGPRTKELAADLEQRGFGVLLVGVQSAQDCTRDAKAGGFAAPYAVDPEGALAVELAAETTTEVFVLDAARTLVYRGMIDDQYGLGYAKPAPESAPLAEALEAVQNGVAVEAGATVAQGCLLELEAEPLPREVTYHNRISRVVQERCLACHREGEAAPFGLETYEQVRKKKSMIAWAVEDGVMPPWFAAEHTGPWKNDASLSASEKADLLAWIDAGAPEGETETAPLARSFTPGWHIGEPDLVVRLPEPVRVPAEGVVDYQYIFTRIDLPEDRWVQAFEIRPTAREVVHHVLTFLERPMGPDGGPDRRQFDGGIDGYFAGAVPGQTWIVYPEGTGKLLPANSWMKFQMHYTPNGTEVFDQTEIGFIFADEPPAHEIRTTSAYARRIAIPPGAFDHEVTAEYMFPEDATLLTLFPHAHLRGNRFLFELERPGQQPEVLLDLPFYDFNWQLAYELAEPLDVPRGTRMRVSAWYDNSEENPANPDPSAWVRFGEQTYEEMMIGYVNWVPAGPGAIEASARKGARAATRSGAPGSSGR